MGKDKDTVIIEVRFCKSKKTLIIWFMEFIPSRNIDENVGYQQILGNVHEEQVEALVSCSWVVHTETTSPNLKLKLHEKKKQGK